MTTRADTIARHLNQAGELLKAAACPGNPQVYATSGPALSIDAAMRCINAAFLEALGGAAVAGEAAKAPSPPKPAGWVVTVPDGPMDLPYFGRDGWHATVVAAQPFRTEQVALDYICGNSWATRARVLPVDAAGNAIEAEDISATLRREECERKAARQAGEEREWEAMRDVSALADEHANDWHALLDHARTAADEVCGPQPVISAREAVTLIERKAFDLRTEAERLRTELAAVKAERDQLADAHRDVSAVAEEHAVAWHSLVDHIRTMADEVCGAQPVIAAAEALSLIESKAHTLRTALYRTEAERDRLRADLDAALTERADLRIALRAVEAERDKLTTDEADLRHALRQIAGMVGGAVSLGASTEMHCAAADEVRAVVGQLRAERDALAAEVQRSREQKPVRWATVRADGTVAESCWFTEEQAMRDARDYGPTYRAAPLYLAPVVRDHSGVIAQCEEALRESSGLVIATDVMRPALRAALSALRGAS